MHFLEKSKESAENNFSITYQQLLRYCQYLTKNEWDGNDLAQETITKAMQAYKNPVVLHRTLLQKVAYHQWIDIVRKRQREVITDKMEEKDYTSLEQSVATDILLEHFTPKQAVVFFLKEAFRFQTSEIAEVLHTTEGSVKSTLHRARKRLEKKEGEDNAFVQSFWTEEERTALTVLFQESLREEDPSILLEALPTIFMTKKSIPTTPAHTPTNIYACAA
ncbi:ECF RNA polymerase sigma factor SigH [Bacillus sp. THAF10]|uniref:sigma-70 family RNA polymerase sigma factor n=1 Tax=Bacillus sp. THAF10 TaxID=2587848 RepID=UPI001267B73B|nr:sigma-70 family RNA polymerase sigma factor [Bacillus sp. THAF10]QFT89056.1 ECF RNA polymerase sigma factor SigH [Bacillus sp. THAF10]